MRDGEIVARTDRQIILGLDSLLAEAAEIEKETLSAGKVIGNNLPVKRPSRVNGGRDNTDIEGELTG